MNLQYFKTTALKTIPKKPQTNHPNHKTFTHDFSPCENAPSHLLKDIYWQKYVGVNPNTLRQCQKIFMEEESLKQLYRNIMCKGSKVCIISETSLTVFLITFKCNVSVKSCSFYSQMTVIMLDRIQGFLVLFHDFFICWNISAIWMDYRQL